MDASSPGYLRTVCEYVHLNPVRAKLLTPNQPLRSYRWSSYPAYLEPSRRRPVWLNVERTFADLGMPKDSAAGRRRFEQVMEERRLEEPEEYGWIRRGWCLGEESFRKELLAQVAERLGAEHYGKELEEGAVAKAERLVRTGLKELGWRETQLVESAKGDPAKVKLALKLRAETTMTLKWIAARLRMGTWTNLSNLLSKQLKKRS